MVEQSQQVHVEVQDHSHHTQRSCNPYTMLLDFTTVAFEPLAGFMVLLGNG
jgi:hypothetical protein